MISKHYMVLDLETTGLPKTKGFGRYYEPSDLAMYETSRIVSIAWMILDSNLEEKEKEYFIVKPNNFNISNQSISIHGITEAYAHENGIQLKDIVNVLEKTLNSYTDIEIVAHNVNFDTNILLSELFRSGSMDLYDKFMSLKRFCTMKHGKDIMQCSKFPRLGELYFFLLQKELTNAHHALSDVESCAKILKNILMNSSSSKPII